MLDVSDHSRSCLDLYSWVIMCFPYHANNSSIYNWTCWSSPAVESWMKIILGKFLLVIKMVFISSTRTLMLLQSINCRTFTSSKFRSSQHSNLFESFGSQTVLFGIRTSEQNLHLCSTWLNSLHRSAPRRPGGNIHPLDARCAEWQNISSDIWRNESNR